MALRVSSMKIFTDLADRKDPDQAPLLHDEDRAHPQVVRTRERAFDRL